ncbi:MAG: chromate transporter [Caldilineaceae bacterium]|nr:chromate transporter [Caldilineaceae bacterium]
MSDSFTRSVESARTISLWRLFWVWILLGAQSFGGGTATLFMIRRAVVDRHRWLSAEEFTRDWAICQAAPGINLLCMTILVGRRVAGMAGALTALFGLMLPSVAITIAMTALYADLRNQPVIQAALRGVVPATVGLGLLLTVNMVRPLLKASQRESSRSLITSLLIVTGSALAVVIWQLPVILVLCSAGIVSGLSLWGETLRRRGDRL